MKQKKSKSFKGELAAREWAVVLDILSDLCIGEPSHPLGNIVDKLHQQLVKDGWKCPDPEVKYQMSTFQLEREREFLEL